MKLRGWHLLGVGEETVAQQSVVVVFLEMVNAIGRLGREARDGILLTLGSGIRNVAAVQREHVELAEVVELVELDRAHVADLDLFERFLGHLCQLRHLARMRIWPPCVGCASGWSGWRARRRVADGTPKMGAVLFCLVNQPTRIYRQLFKERLGGSIGQKWLGGASTTAKRGWSV